MSEQLATTAPAQTQEAAAFELLQRAAKMLSASTLVPKEFQGNMANCAIGINIAKRLGADPFMVIQNIDIIHGRPSFRATFLIAMVNASGRFTPLQFRMTGEGASRACVAHCTIKDTGEAVEGPEITMAMAKAEGWSTKSGSKWVTMPELMLRYRAAAFFARIYAPDITLGMQTSEEVFDITERQAVGREVPAAQVPALFSNVAHTPIIEQPSKQSQRSEFWDKVDAEQMDDQKVMAVIRENKMSEADYPADLEESVCAELLKPEQWKVLCDLYAKGGAK